MPIMIDLETMGSNPKAAVLSIGAIDFLYTGIIEREFYCNLSLEENVKLGREINPKTVEWWLQQSKEAQNSLFVPEPKKLINLELFQFCMWIKASVEDKPEMWANGITFDFPILRSLLNDTKIEVPWSYKQEMCLRPIRLLGKQLGVEYSKDRKTAHNALEDAKNQAKYLCEVWKKRILQ